MPVLDVLGGLAHVTLPNLTPIYKPIGSPQDRTVLSGRYRLTFSPSFPGVQLFYHFHSFFIIFLSMTGGCYHLIYIQVKLVSYVYNIYIII